MYVNLFFLNRRKSTDLSSFPLDALGNPFPMIERISMAFSLCVPFHIHGFTTAQLATSCHWRLDCLLCSATAVMNTLEPAFLHITCIRLIILKLTKKFKEERLQATGKICSQRRLCGSCVVHSPDRGSSVPGCRGLCQCTGAPLSIHSYYDRSISQRNNLWYFYYNHKADHLSLGDELVLQTEGNCLLCSDEHVLTFIRLFLYHL